jgi:formamidopyrimidine-DNA glycosylase
MPELPEVETVARGLQQAVAGDVIESVWIGKRPQVLKSAARAIAHALTGAKIAAVRRVGKHIVVDLDRAASSKERAPDSLMEPGRPRPGKQHEQWVVHLGMTGSFVVCPANAPVEKHTHLVAQLRSGRELHYVDPRMFGKLAIASAAFAAPGAEPLDVAPAQFATLFHRTRAPIKSALLNQSLLSGVGNIYADEALFRAGIRPRRRAHTLTRTELRRLYESLREVLHEAIAAGGTTVNDYMNALGESGRFQFDLRAYGREGEPCLRCRAAIKRIVISGRSAHYCAACQK